MATQWPQSFVLSCADCFCFIYSLPSHELITVSPIKIAGSYRTPVKEHGRLASMHDKKNIMQAQDLKSNKKSDLTHVRLEKALISTRLFTLTGVRAREGLLSADFFTC